jgi:hypothetical protein
MLATSIEFIAPSVLDPGTKRMPSGGLRGESSAKGGEVFSRGATEPISAGTIPIRCEAGPRVTRPVMLGIVLWIASFLELVLVSLIPMRATGSE